MAKFNNVVITDSGLELVAATHSGSTIQFTAIKTGGGVYDGTEVLENMTDLKEAKQTFGITSVIREDAVVKVRSLLSNEGLTQGYYLSEIGLYALDPNTNTEILYAIIVAENGTIDYLTPYEEFPQSITFEVYITVTGVEEGVTFTASILDNVYVSAQEHSDHVNNADIHITAAERTAWSNKLDSDGTAAMATADAQGNNIVDTYATKTQLAKNVASTNNLKIDFKDLGSYYRNEGTELIMTGFLVDNLISINISGYVDDVTATGGLGTKLQKIVDSDIFGEFFKQINFDLAVPTLDGSVRNATLSVMIGKGIATEFVFTKEGQTYKTMNYSDYGNDSSYALEGMNTLSGVTIFLQNMVGSQSIKYPLAINAACCRIIE